MKTKNPLLALLLLSTLLSPLSTFGQGTAFTYQGFLTDQGGPANGAYDLEFRVFDAVSNGGQWGNPVTVADLGITNGLFTVTLDPGASIFTGAGRWLDIAVRPGLSAGAYTNLTPRQPITPTPYAIYAATAGTAATVYGNVPAGQITGTIPLVQLPASVVTNGASSVNISGTFSGNGAGVTNVNLALSSGGAITWGSFVLASSLGVGAPPYSVVTGDVNGDGKPDLIIANAYTDLIGVYTNDGSGGFPFISLWGAGSGPYSVAAADVNGDGRVDLISANVNDSTLSLLTNDGSGGFVLASSPVVGNTPYSVTAADVNADGRVDLISADFGNGFGNTLTALTNNGSGGFVLASSPVVGSGPASVVAADINADGKVDLISANYGTGSGNTLTVLTNNGSGGFVLASSPVVGNGPDSVVAADVNGDGRVDLISANAIDSTLSVLTNNGSGSFVLASSPVVGAYPFSVTAADVDGDGKVDLISANNGYDTLSVLINNGSAGFVLASSPGVDNGPNSVAAADFNGDGKPDLISANVNGNTLSLLINTPTFKGNGAGLTGLNAANLVGSVPSAALTSVPAANLTGTILDARLSANVALRGGGNAFTGNQTIAGSLGVVGGDINWSTGGALIDNQGGSIELGPAFDNTARTPFIDFHFGSGAVEDYNVRLINNGDGQLDIGRNSGTLMARFNSGGLTVNGTFVSASDRNVKENFKPVDPRAVLDKVAALPLSEWNYKADTASRHVGPMAQDFYAAFGVGPDDKHIATVDADGVALAAIQGLNEKVESGKQKAEIRIQKLEVENAELKSRLAKLEQLMNEKNGGGK